MTVYSREETRLYDKWYETWRESHRDVISNETMTNVLRSTHLPDTTLAKVI
jgi:hypothetical protein